MAHEVNCLGHKGLKLRQTRKMMPVKVRPKKKSVGIRYAAHCRVAKVTITADVTARIPYRTASSKG